MNYIMIYFLFFIFIVGLCIGSFLNVVILRAFSNESIVYPASKCPKCQHALKWYHNIPVFSYIFLKGKCAFCSEKISIQYPIIELITGLIYTIIFCKYGLTIQTIFFWYFASIFIVLAVTDLKEKVIFTRHTYFLTFGGLLFNILNLNPMYHSSVQIFGFPVFVSIISSLLGLLIGILLMEILARTGYLFAGTRAFGEGDTYIAAGLGALFGLKGLVVMLVLSVIIQLVITIPLFINKLVKNKDFITLISLFLFIIAAVIYKSNILPFIISTIFLFITAGYLSYKILKDLKKKSDMMYLPFGPAMVFASFIIILI